MKIKRLHPDAKIPAYAHGPESDAGMDLCAIEDVLLEPEVPTLVKTGLSIELPAFYEAQVRPRSGLALKHGISVVNAPGTIDPAYRGDLGVILRWGGWGANWSDMLLDDDNNELGEGPVAVERRFAASCEFFKISKGDRIAQMVVARYEPVEFEEAELSDTTRGVGGFGSSGV